MSPRSLLLCALIAWALSNEPALLAQSNDNFSDRLTLGGMSATAVSNNLKATAEPGEPNHAGQSAGRSLWWSWKAPGSGPVNFSLFDGGAMPNVVRHTLAVYTGDSLDNLSQVAATSGTTSANLSNSGSGIGDYSVSFQAVAGTVYQIAVDDYNAVSLSAAGSDSTVVLGINQAPVIVSLAALTTTLKNNFFYTIQASNQPTDYAASGLPPGLAINPATGYISGTPSATGTFPVQLSAANAGGAGTGVLTLTVNEASSSSSSSTSSATKTPPGLTSVASARGVVGAAFSLAATVSGADTGSLRVTGLPPGLDYDDFFNSIAGIPTAPGVYPVTFSASNAGGAFSAVVTVVIAAKPNLPVVSSALAANATVGKSFNYYIGSQTYDAGGQTRYGATNLPPGLGLDGSSGIIGGAPTTAGVYAVSISATNAAGTSWAVVTITVDPADASAANAAPFFTGTAIQSFQINVPVSTQLSAINSPASFTASNLPPGLSMNLANGYLVGTPTALGEYRVPISATNAYGTANVTLTIRVTAFAPSTGAATVNSSTYLVGSAAAAAATVGSSFSYTIALSTLSTSATGATPSYLYAYTASTLPDGLIFNPATGVISGTPTAAGTYSIDLGCSYYPDSAARTLGLASSRIQTPPATLTLVVAASAAPVTAPPLIVANANVSVTAGNAFYYYLGATNGGTAFTASGLPAGTSISASAGTISGTPTAAGTYAVNVTAANAVGTGAAVVTFVVAPAAAASAAAPPPPQINTDAFTSGTLGSSFGFSISATNSPTAYAASGLPPGLAVNSASGYISGTPTTAGEYNVTLSATNAVGTATAPLALRIDPISAPVVSSASSAAGYVGAAFSYSISRSGSSSVTGYSASNLPPGLSLSSASGAITGTPTTAGVYAVPVSVTTAAGVANATVTITIAATPPAPIMSGKAVYNGAVGQGFSYSIPPSGASGGYTAANLPGGLTLNASTGAISGTPTAAGTYLVPISATTAGGTSNATVTFAIAGTAGSGQAPVISSPAATYGQVNAPFSYQITAANSPTSFDASALPPGLTINPATGVISGTPTAAGTYAVNVAAFNANPAGSNAGQAQVTMVFSGSLTGSPVISSPALYSGDVGAAFAYQIAASDYPTSFSAASIPSGLTLNSTTGLISGTPTQSGSYTVTLGAANALGSGSARVTLLLRNLPTALWRVTSSAAAVGVAGTAFSYTVTGNFSTASYPFYNPSGLPPGLTFSSSTSRLSGTPTVAGNYDVTFANNYASAVVRITILAASNANSTVPAFTNPASVNAFVGEPFSFALSATNNPASWSVGSLPAGLKFDAATGAISGTPTQATAASSIRITATNGAGAGAATLTLPVLAANLGPLRGSSAAAQSGWVGSPFSYKFADNFQGSYTYYNYYSSPIILPPGLSFNATTGEISGTPTTAGTFTPNFQFYSSSVGSVGVTPTFIIRSAPTTPPAVSSAASAAGAVGLPFSYALAATNLPSGFRVGALPAGLAFLPDLNVISGTPTAAGQFSVPITAANAIGQSSAILTLAIAAAPPAPSLADSNLAASAALGATGVFYRISATNNPTSYSAANLPPGLTLDTVNGVISGTAAAAGVYAATISAANAGGSASAVATITVNSAAPVFVSTAATLTGTVGITLYSSLSASNYPTNYALSDLPPGLYFNPALAQISGTPSAAGIYQVSCTASNAAGSTAATLTFVVSPPKPPIFSSVFSSYYDTTVGGLFSEVMFSSSNNIMTYSASGLPPGIACITDSLTADLRGSPQVAGVYPVTIVASNGDGATATMRLVINVKPVSVTVNAPTTAPLITSSASVSGVAGSAFSYQISGSGSPTGFTASGLPDSLSVNAATGLISGTPQQAGSFPVAISAANAVGTANAVVTLVIASTAPPVNVVPLITSPATRMVQASTASGSLYLLSPTAAFSYPIQATGSPSAYSASGLPPGLSLNPNSGLISGRPGAPGTYRVNVTATNAAGTGAATLTLVAPPFAPTFSGAVLEMAGVVGMSLSSSISSLTVTSLSSLTHLADGSNYVTFTASGLPPGLSINPGTGQITGQPTRAGVYPTTLSLNGSTNAVTYLTTFAISASAAGVGLPKFTSRAAALGLTGAPFSQSVQAANAASYAASGLPAGLSLNSATGAITGTPTAAGVSYATISATNANGTAQAMLTIIVTDQAIAPTMANAAFVGALVGQPFTYTLSASASSNSAPFGITGYNVGSLPAGLYFDPSQHQIIGTPTQTGTFVIPLSISSYNAAAQGVLTLRVQNPSTPAAPVTKPTISARAGLLGLVANPFVFGVGSAAPDAADLPAGLSFDAAQSAIAGYPAAAGNSLVDLNASNAFGTAQAALNLRVITPDLSLPRIVAAPASQTVADQGASITLTGLAVGIPAPSYQWRRDGALIPGATSGALTLSNVQSADVGAYTLTAVNSSGSVTTSAANVLMRASYAAWQTSHFSAPEIAAGFANDSADFNGDGVANLLEYALGRDPRTGQGGNLPIAALAPAQDYLQLQFSRDASATDLNYLVEVSSDLTNWTPIAQSQAGQPTTNLGGAGFVMETGAGATKTVLVQDAQRVDGTAVKGRFMRLRITRLQANRSATNQTNTRVHRSR